MKKRLLKINELLIKKFGIPKRNKKRPDPVDLLIATILSQNTNDANSFKAYQNLKKYCPHWESAAKLNVRTLKNLIKTAGLGEQKARTIKNFLSYLIKTSGTVSLNKLEKLNDEEILDELTKHSGIGIKTASCVLLFSWDRNICPVDTHVHRTLNRIGIIKTVSPEKTFFSVLPHIPEGAAHSIHSNLIRLGREICRPVKPLCSICPLLKICSFPLKNRLNNLPAKQKSFLLLDNIS
jgi:endonuclease-3